MGKNILPKRLIAVLLTLIIVFSSLAVNLSLVMAADDVDEGVIIVDDENGESYAYTSITNEQVKVGANALKSNTVNHDGWITFAGFWGADALPAKDLSEVTNNGTSGALKFWLYVEDITMLDDVKEMQENDIHNIIKLGDAKSPDGNYYRWNHWIDQVTASGWNEVILKFADASIEGNEPDITAIDTLYMKLSNGASSRTLYLDDIRVVATTDDGDDDNQEDGDQSGDDNQGDSGDGVIIVDDENGESYAYTSITNEQVKVGANALKSNTVNHDGWITFAGFWGADALPAKDLSEVTNNGTSGALKFWLYVEDITMLDDVKEMQENDIHNIIKLGDAKSPDGNYYRWNHWIDQVTASGWNEVILEFADASIEGNEPDITAIDTLYMKLSNGASSRTLYLDDIRVVATDDGDDDNQEDGDQSGDDNQGDSGDGVIIVDDENGEAYAYTSITAEQVKVGSKALKSTTADHEGWITFAGFWGADALPAKDLSEVTNNGTSGALKFWLYVEDITMLDDVKEMQANGTYSIIKLGDAKSPDGNYYRWNHWIDQVTASGWNEVILKFADASIEGSGPDITAIDTLYMKLSNGASSKILYLDDIRVVATDDEESEQSSAIKDIVIAKLDGTEWPICHPGLTGQFNTADYDAMHFDRRFSYIPEGDIKTTAYIKRTAVSGLSTVDISKHNTVTLDLIVEDNGAWEDYKNNLIFKIRTLNDTIDVSSTDFKESLSSVVPGEITHVVISLESVGKKNLTAVDGFSISLADGSSDKILHLTITNVVAEYNENYPAVPNEKTESDGENSEDASVIFAKLDGTEWPIVHPGLNSDYHAMNLDRIINYTPRNTEIISAESTVYNRINVIRTEAGYSPADFTKCNVIRFNVFVEDNGAWEEYKENLNISLTTSDGVAHPLSRADVLDGLSNVALGKWCTVTISLGGLHKGELEDITTFGLSLKDGSSNKDLHIKMSMIKATYDGNYPSVPEEPANDDPYLILNDELGEKAWPAVITNDISRVGARSYKATTLVIDTGFNEGWLIRTGYFGSAQLTRTIDMSGITANGTKGAIRFWLYTENAEATKKAASSSHCRLGSDTNWDTDWIQWTNWASQIINDGWNEVVLAFDKGSISGTVDFSKITSFALKLGEGQDLAATTVYLDDIRVSSNDASALPISREPTIAGAKMFQPFEEMYGLNTETSLTAFELDLKEKTQGMSSLKIGVNNGRFTFVYRTGDDTVDASEYNCLEFDVFVPYEDFFEFAGGQIELTSSGIWDQNEIAWSLSDLDLSTGWNHVKLSFDYAGYTVDYKNENDIDLTAINFMRIYTGTAEDYVGKELTFRFDNMCFTKNGETKIEKSVTINNSTGYELYLTAKPDIIPAYGELSVTKLEKNTLPEVVQALFADESDTLVIDPTFYKDSIEYLFGDTVTIHLSKNNMTNFENRYVYRLDVNGSFRKLSRIDNNSKKELIWDEPTRLATYIISDVLIEDDVLAEVEKDLEGSSLNNIALIAGIAAAALAVILMGVIISVVFIRKRRATIKEKN